MIVLYLLILTLIMILIIWGLRLNMSLYKHGSLYKVQRDDRKRRKISISHNLDNRIKQEINSDVTVQAKLRDLFGPYKAEATGGYPVWITVWTATYNEGQIQYIKYIKSFTDYEEWQPDTLSADDFHKVTADGVPQSVEAYLNKMILGS